jgi:mRNA-degrading endonuclease toxin of MazEF toxin-antitoxin module
MRSQRYGDPLAPGARRRREIKTVVGEPGLVVEDPASGFCGAVVTIGKDGAVLEDAEGRRRVFPLRPGGFLIDGQPVTVVRPATPTAKPARSASGSVRMEGQRARVARAGRIWVEGIHDAALVEQVWGHDLRVEGVVVEPLHGVDDLAGAVAAFAPGPDRRLGVLVDHLVAGSKETRVAAGVAGRHVLVTGHPYVDVWQAVRPAAVRIERWPDVPLGTDWKTGVCAALGWGDPADGARRVLGAVRDFRDLETPLITAVERLIDFVTGAP